MYAVKVCSGLPCTGTATVHYISLHGVRVVSVVQLQASLQTQTLQRFISRNISTDGLRGSMHKLELARICL